jgi:hypothetical protein
LLNIPVELVGSGDVTLRVAYQKYCAYLAATQKLERMIADKTWLVKKPTKTDLIELFVSKSFFHSHYRRFFSKVAEYPEMVAWLENSEDQLDDVDLWGLEKTLYVFKDLDVWLQNGGSLEKEEKEEEKKKKKKKEEKGDKENTKDKKKKGKKVGKKLG